MKLAVIFPALNQQELTQTAVDFAVAFSNEPIDVIVLDNGSGPALDIKTPPQSKVNFKLVCLDKNIGVYPAFWEALKYTDADVLAYLHTDLFICEKGYDKRLLSAFSQFPKLGLVGFIGSDAIDSMGGRGYGTVSNFQGATHQHHSKIGVNTLWIGTPAERHGRRSTLMAPAAVVDGCSMVFRREVLEKIKQRPEFPPHHFYDRLLSCETREAGYDVVVLGIACDHISGQSVNGSDSYERMAREWANVHGLEKREKHNWDSVLYEEAERQWLVEYRDAKHFIPCKV